MTPSGRARISPALAVAILVGGGLPTGRSLEDLLFGDMPPRPDATVKRKRVPGQCMGIPEMPCSLNKTISLTKKRCLVCAIVADETDERNIA